MIDAEATTMPGQRAGPDRGPDQTGLPVLLLVALAAVLVTVGAVWALAATSAMWAIVVAMVVAASGMFAVLAVVDRQLGDSDGASSAGPRLSPE